MEVTRDVEPGIQDNVPARTQGVMLHARRYAGPWRSDDPIIHDEGIALKVVGPEAGDVSWTGERFVCRTALELYCQETHIETYGAVIEGRAVAGAIEILDAEVIGETTAIPM